MDTCEKCGQSFRIGDWPFCPHGRPYGSIGRAAHPQERTVVFQHPGTGKVSYPMRNDQPMNAQLRAWGYERKELPNLRSLEHFEKEQGVRNDAVWFDKGTGNADKLPESKPIDMTGLEFKPLG